MDRAEAFERYVVPEIATLLRVARSLTGNVHDAEDVVQDTLVAAFRGVHRFDGRHPRAWILTILRNAERSRWRQHKATPVGETGTFERLPDGDPDPEAAVVGSAASDELMAALFALRPEHRRVVELIDAAGLRYREAACVIGVPVSTVTARLHSARAEMRGRLDGGRKATRRQRAAS